MDVLPAVAKSVNLGQVPANTPVHLTIALNPPSLSAIQAFADSVSDPKNPNYGHFLTPAQFGAKFGASQTTISQVTSYLKQQGLTITKIEPSNLAIVVDGTAVQAEKAFNTVLARFHSNVNDPAGRSDYFAYTQPLELPSSISSSVVLVSGMENYQKGVPLLQHKVSKIVPDLTSLLFGKQSGVQCLTPTQTRTLYNTAPIYNAGLTGANRTIAISNFDGYRLSNVPLYYSQYNLAKPSGGVGSNITVVTVDGGSGAGTPAGEGDLDIQMVLATSSTCSLLIYDGGGALFDVLTQEANDNLADIVTESYGWALGTADAEACHTVHLQMTSQGMTYLKATGDSGTQVEPYGYGDYDPEILLVGGTVATVTTNGTRVSEITWGSGSSGGEGGGGGYLTESVPFNVLPTWQKGKGVPTSINYRLFPDVALNAAGNPGAYYFFYNGSLGTGDGTSFASPVCAGSLGVAEQKLISLGDITVSNGVYRLGRLATLIYGQNGRPDVYYDITSGPAIGMLPNGQVAAPGPGWDFCSGWGPLNFNAFVATFQPANTPYNVGPSSVGVYDSQGGTTSGGVSQLTAIDQQYFKENSTYTTQGSIAATLLTYQLTKPVSSLVGLTLNLVEGAPQTATTFVYLKNYTTNGFDLVSTTGNSGLDITLSIPITSYSTYVSSTGAMQVVVRQLVPSRLGVLFQSRLDYAVVVEAVKS